MEHMKLTDKLIGAFDLEEIRHAMVKKLSGGEKKRLSIANEMTSQVDLLVLDEPTTGLDFSITLSLIRKLKEISASRSMAILITIHQPSNEVILMFENLYLLSARGDKIFLGKPSQLIPYLELQGAVCQKNRSISDVALKFAKNSLYDGEIFDMDDFVLQENPNHMDFVRKHNYFRVSFCEIRLLMSRYMTIQATRTPVVLLMILLMAQIAFLSSKTMKYPMGREDGCQLQFVKNASSRNELRYVVTEKVTRVSEASTLMFMMLTVIYQLTPMLGAMLVNFDFKMVKREIDNQWYSHWSYMTAIILHGTTLTLMLTLTYQLVFHLTSEIDLDIWRTLSWTLLLASLGFVTFLYGLIVGLILKDNTQDVVIVLMATLVAPILLSCFYVRYQDAYWMLKPFISINIFDNCFKALLAVTYGFARCPEVVAGQKSVLDEMLQYSSPRDIINRALYGSGMTDDNIAIWSQVLNVNQSIIGEIFNKSLALSVAPEAETIPVPPSYILEKFAIQDDGKDILQYIIWIPCYVIVMMVLVRIFLSRALK
ncbi:Protein white [Halotydeus destructor]|nr:Protein white [Halotydeus destructor]